MTVRDFSPLMSCYAERNGRIRPESAVASDGLPDFPSARIATMKNQYRVTKYNPSLREATGAYTGCDWTSRSDIGRVFDGGMLSEKVYLKVENSYFSAMKSFLDEAGIESLELKGIGTSQHLRRLVFARRKPNYCSKPRFRASCPPRRSLGKTRRTR